MAEPPKCDQCDQPATVFVSYVKENAVHQAKYCQEHAQKAGVLDPSGYNLLPDSTPAKPAATDTSPRCPACGCSQRDFERTGRLGCAQCYGTFSETLQPMLRRMHRSETHCGKVPARNTSSDVLQQQIERLKRELDEAVGAEQYEQAAILRDQISTARARLEQLQGTTS
jgi:protein arginine kinase activator